MVRITSAVHKAEPVLAEKGDIYTRPHGYTWTPDKSSASVLRKGTSAPLLQSPNDRKYCIQNVVLMSMTPLFGAF